MILNRKYFLQFSSLFIGGFFKPIGLSINQIGIYRLL